LENTVSCEWSFFVFDISFAEEDIESALTPETVDRAEGFIVFPATITEYLKDNLVGYTDSFVGCGKGCKVGICGLVGIAWCWSSQVVVYYRWEYWRWYGGTSFGDGF